MNSIKETEKAIEVLEGLAVPIHAEPAFDMAIEALRKRKVGLEILERERKLNFKKLEAREYHRGRLTGLYNGLGIDFFN